MRRVAMVLLCIVPLGERAAVGPAVTGLATAGVAGTVGSATGDAALGIAAGVVVSLGADQAVKWGERRVAEHVQQAVAATAGPLEIGQSGHWESEHWLPFSARAGTVEVARSFGQAIPCKDVVYTLDEDKDHNIFATTICRNDQGEWRWALSEPSVYRWGYLQ